MRNTQSSEYHNPNPQASSKVAYIRPQAVDPASHGLGSFYEEVLLDTLRNLWRRALMIVSIVALGVVLAFLFFLTRPEAFTASSVIQRDFTIGAAGAAAAAAATVDAAIIVEGEARLLRSPTIMRRVVQRLKLHEDPAYTSPGRIKQLLNLIVPSPATATPNSNIELAVRRLSRQIAIANDPRSYAISINVGAGSPEWAAQLANAVASEYLGHRSIQQFEMRQTTAQNELTGVRTVFGPKHPNTIRAETKLASAKALMLEQERLRTTDPSRIGAVPGYQLVRAEPNWLPVGPNLIMYLALGFIGSLCGALGLALFLDYGDKGFRSERDVIAATGTDCLAMIPKKSDWRRRSRQVERKEAFRSLCLTAGLTKNRASSKALVAMITTPLPTENKAAFVDELAETIAADGKRVLIVDVCPLGRGRGDFNLEDAALDMGRLRDFFDKQRGKKITRLWRNPTDSKGDSPLRTCAPASEAIQKLIEIASVAYDVIIIDAPPTLLFSESLLFGEHADVCLQVANWNSTPRSTMVEAVRRLSSHDVTVSGIVLTEVDLGRYASFGARDRTYYLSKFHNLFPSASAHQSPVG